MHWSHILVASGLLAGVSGHGLVTSIQVADGTPRDCSSNGCGSQADTSIIRDREIRSGKASALGRTQGNGPVDAKVMISNFMGAATAPTNKGAASSSGVEDDLSALKGISGNDSNSNKTKKRGFFGDLFNNITGGGGNKGTKSNQAAETAVAASAGKGAQSGLPTCADDGSITMTFRQINQDGAGPLFADVDGTSGGTDPAAFQKAEVTQDVPGVPIAGGLSLATKTDFPLTVQMPPGMTCEATVAGVKNVCVVRVRNKAIAGPFGGSAAFTMSHAAQKRALEYRLKKRTEEETGAQNKHRRLRLY